MRRNGITVGSMITLLLLLGTLAIPGGADPEHHDIKGDCRAGFGGAWAKVEVTNHQGTGGLYAYATAFVRWVGENDPQSDEDGPYTAASHSAIAEAKVLRELFGVPASLARVAEGEWTGRVQTQADSDKCVHNCWTVQNCIGLQNLPAWAQLQLVDVGCSWTAGSAEYGYSGDLFLDEATESLLLVQHASTINLTATPLLNAAAQVTPGGPVTAVEPTAFSIDAFGNDMIGCRFSVHDNE